MLGLNVWIRSAKNRTNYSWWSLFSKLLNYNYLFVNWKIHIIFYCFHNLKIATATVVHQRHHSLNIRYTIYILIYTYLYIIEYVECYWRKIFIALCIMWQRAKYTSMENNNDMQCYSKVFIKFLLDFNVEFNIF